ncbi:MAG: hypothetical protein M3494_08255 [Actinomycetota bacterium]|nr:hypothetical protein [Actinomycetota bacterium]
MQKAMTLPVESEEVRGISVAGLVRGSGILAIIVGASTVLSPVIHPHSPQSAAWVPVHVASFAALIGLLLVLVGIFARQMPRAGKLGVAGFLAAFVGTAMIVMEGREHIFSPDFGVGVPLGLWELVLASFVFSVGYILLGASIARAGVLPRGAGVLLAVSHSDSPFPIREKRWDGSSSGRALRTKASPPPTGN